MSRLSSARSRSSRPSPRGRVSTIKHSTNTPGFIHTGSTHSNPSVRTSNRSSLLRIGEDGETATYLPATALSEALRHTVSASEANDTARLRLQQEMQKSQVDTNASRSRMFDVFADQGKLQAQQDALRLVVDQLERMADINRKVNQQKFDQSLSLLSHDNIPSDLRADAEKTLRELRAEDLSVASMLASMGYPAEKVYSILTLGGIYGTGTHHDNPQPVD